MANLVCEFAESLVGYTCAASQISLTLISADFSTFFWS